MNKLFTNTFTWQDEFASSLDCLSYLQHDLRTKCYTINCSLIAIIVASQQKRSKRAINLKVKQQLGTLSNNIEPVPCSNRLTNMFSANWNLGRNHLDIQFEI